jgi:hypothetical protein
MQSLERLRHTTNDDPTTMPEGDSGGFLNVLWSFANGMGYTVKLVDNMTHNAQIIYKDSLIKISTVVTNDLCQAYMLAHEIAHDYVADIYGTGSYTKRARVDIEQVTEAVAALIMDEYGFDVHDASAAYIDATALYYAHNHKPLVNYFRRGKLDNKIKRCYRSFSADLQHFLKDGGTHGIHGAT